MIYFWNVAERNRIVQLKRKGSRFRSWEIASLARNRDAFRLLRYRSELICEKINFACKRATTEVGGFFFENKIGCVNGNDLFEKYYGGLSNYCN